MSKIVILSRQPQLYANQRLIAAAKKRACAISVLDPLHVPVLLPASDEHGSPDFCAYDAVLPRFGPLWQRQGNTLLTNTLQQAAAFDSAFSQR